MAIASYRFPGLFSDGKNIYTRNPIPGQSVYGEILQQQDGVEYRRWNPKRSKLAAMLHSGVKTFPFKGNSKVLYLGAATGTTVSHISDIVIEGTIYCVEISQVAFRSLLKLSEKRKNLVPILGDASRPDSYKSIVPNVGIVYQDIAQANQAELFVRNIEAFMPGGYGFLLLKARSIDVTSRPKDVFREEIGQLERKGLKIIETIDVHEFEKDHCGVVVRKE